MYRIYLFEGPIAPHALGCIDQHPKAMKNQNSWFPIASVDHHHSMSTQQALKQTKVVLIQL